MLDNRKAKKGFIILHHLTHEVFWSFVLVEVFGRFKVMKKEKVIKKRKKVSSFFITWANLWLWFYEIINLSVYAPG